VTIQPGLNLALLPYARIALGMISKGLKRQILLEEHALPQVCVYVLIHDIDI